MKFSKNDNNKKPSSKLISFNEKKPQKIRMIFYIEKWLWKSDLGTFWQPIFLFYRFFLLKWSRQNSTTEVILKNINENKDVKYLECDYLSCVTVRHTLVKTRKTYCGHIKIICLDWKTHSWAKLKIVLVRKPGRKFYYFKAKFQGSGFSFPSLNQNIKVVIHYTIFDLPYFCLKSLKRFCD